MNNLILKFCLQKSLKLVTSNLCTFYHAFYISVINSFFPVHDTNVDFNFQLKGRHLAFHNLRN